MSVAICAGCSKPLRLGSRGKETTAGGGGVAGSGGQVTTGASGGAGVSSYGGSVPSSHGGMGGTAARDGAPSADGPAVTGAFPDAGTGVETGDVWPTGGRDGTTENEAGTGFPEPTKPGCAGLPANCGASGLDSCCASLAVPGGSFNRSNSPEFPATVSDFILDKYEVTVGRFRAFVAGGFGTQANPPAAGAGAHPLIEGSGWNPEWKLRWEALAPDTASLKAVLSCDSATQTWTDSAGANENLPINCVNWYEAFAFCAWDGGRLATEAEWNYAAAGGELQRKYPWGDTEPEPSLVVIYCSADGVRGCLLADILTVGSRPTGNGLWGHADLAGSMGEWVLDWKADYVNPCIDCANVAAGTNGRVARGGNFNDDPSTVSTDFRTYASPWARQSNHGFRCARSP